MGAEAGGPALEVARCVADVETADFVAIDLEFSGLFLSPERERHPPPLSEHFIKCVESIPEFLPLQLGVCCCRKRADGVWDLRAHEVNLWPQQRRVFSADLQSLRFLRANGFDFNAFFEQGHLYSRLPSLDDPKKVPSRQLPRGTQVIHALREARCPLVFHNGLLDLLHLYDKFLGDLPRSPDAFGDAWTRHFPLLFDTRHIAQEGRYNVFRHAGGFSLEELHRHLSCLAIPGLSAPAVRFERLGPLGGKEEKERPAHGSAAQDATLTAEVFLMEMDFWLRSHDSAASKRQRLQALESELGSVGAFKARSAALGEAGAKGAAGAASMCASRGVVGQGKRKRSREGSGAAGEVSDGLASPDLLESHEVCRRFHNWLAIVGASPGALNLGDSQPVSGLVRGFIETARRSSGYSRPPAWPR